MNIGNIKLLRDHIAILKDDEWNINVFSKCFCGHMNNTFNICYAWHKWLGITVDARLELTSDNSYSGTRDHNIPISIAQACAVLDNLINTGKVDWDYAIANPAKLDEVKS